MLRAHGGEKPKLVQTPNYYAYTPNYYAHTPYPNKLRSFHFEPEYYVCLTCLHTDHENNTTCPYQEPAIVGRCHGRPVGFTAGFIAGFMTGFTTGFTAGSTNRIDNSTQRSSQYSSEVLAALPEGRRGRGCERGRGSRYSHRGNLQTLNTGRST